MPAGSTNFPTGLDSNAVETNTDEITSTDQNDRAVQIEALEAKVGIDSSTVTTSHDYKLSGVTGTDKAVSKAGSETLTNKTLTSPTLQGTLDGWISANQTWTYASATTITVPSGAASRNQPGDFIKWTQTTVKYAEITGVADTVLTVRGDAVTDAAITANYYSKARSPVGIGGPTTLGYAQITSDFTTATTPADVDVTGLAVTVTVPSGGRRIKITVFAPQFYTTQNTGQNLQVKIKEGADTLSYGLYKPQSTFDFTPMTVMYCTAASAGSHTYKVAMSQSAAGSLHILATATAPAFILVELI